MTVTKQVVDGFEGLADVFRDIETQWRNMDFRSQMRQFEEDLETLHGSYHTSQRDPEHTPWLPLSPYTVKKKGHARILYETGRLLASVTSDTDDSVRRVTRNPLTHKMEFGTRRPDAWKHQDGFRNIPQREHVGITDQYLEPFVDVIADATVEQLMYED